MASIAPMSHSPSSPAWDGSRRALRCPLPDRKNSVSAVVVDLWSPDRASGEQGGACEKCPLTESSSSTNALTSGEPSRGKWVGVNPPLLLSVPSPAGLPTMSSGPFSAHEASLSRLPPRELVAPT